MEDHPPNIDCPLYDPVLGHQMGGSPSCVLPLTFSAASSWVRKLLKLDDQVYVLVVYRASTMVRRRSLMASASSRCLAVTSG
jgi:hypothetical protein